MQARYELCTQASFYEGSKKEQLQQQLPAAVQEKKVAPGQARQSLKTQTTNTGGNKKKQQNQAKNAKGKSAAAAAQSGSGNGAPAKATQANEQNNNQASQGGGA